MEKTKVSYEEKKQKNQHQKFQKAANTWNYLDWLLTPVTINLPLFILVTSTILVYMLWPLCRESLLNLDQGILNIREHDLLEDG